MKRSELVKALESVMVGVEKSGNSFMMDFVAFDTDWVRSFKDEIAVSYPFPVGIQAAIKANEVFKILSKMEEEDVTLEVGKEGNSVEVKDGKTTLTLNALQKESFKNIINRASSLITNDLEWFYLPKEFKKGLGLCTLDVKKGKSLEKMAGVHIEGNLVISTDSYRVSTFLMDEGVSIPFTIPTETAKQILGIPVDLTTISLTPAWVHLSNESGVIFSARLLSDIYPVDKVKGAFATMKFDPSGDFFTFPEGIDKALERAEIMADVGEDITHLSQVDLSYENGKMVLTGSREIGAIREEIVWNEKHIPEGLRINMVPEYLKRILGITKKFQISPTKKGIILFSDKFQHLMVVRAK